MRVLFDLSFVRKNPYMGISKYAYRILDYIVCIGKQEDFILLLNPQSESVIRKLYPQFRYHTLGCKVLASVPTLGTIIFSFLFKRYANSCNYDLIFCPWGNTISCQKIKTKKISVIHDLQFRKDTKGLTRKLRAFIDDSVVKNSSKIVTISNFSKEEILSFYPTISNKLISLGNVVSFSKDFSVKHSDEKYLLYVGRICQMKNVATLVKAFGIIANKIPHSLYIVGNKTKYWNKEIIPIINKYHIETRVKVLTGVAEFELNGLYKFADLFIFPSLREGFGFPPIEAAYMETRVLCTKCDSLQEVTMNLLNYYNNPTDENELSEKILEIIHQKKDQQNLEKIANTFKSKYSVEVVSKRIYDYIVNEAEQK